MSDVEALSRLAAGDLDPAETLALQARLASEPRLRSQWDDLQVLLADLGELPEERPPARLDAAVLRGTQEKRPRTRIPLGWLAALAAVVLAAVNASRPQPRSEIVAGPGESAVSGHVDVILADATVLVDGTVEVDVEPATGLARAGQRGGDPMAHPALIAGSSAMAGALAAVVVMEGTALVSYDGGPASLLSAGQTWSAPNADNKHVASRSAPAEDTVADLRARVVSLEAELDQVRHEAESARIAGAIANGQLANVQGQPAIWPTDVPEPLKPTEYEADVRAAVASIPGAKVSDVDCSEYPCLALVTLTTDGDVEALRPQLDGIAKSLRDGPWNGLKDLSVTMGQSVSTNDDGPGGSVVLGIGASTKPTIDTTQRTKYRLDTLMTDAAEEVQKH